MINHSSYFFIYPCIHESSHRSTKISDQQLKCIIDIGLKEGINKDYILNSLKELNYVGYQEPKIEKKIDSSNNARKMGMIAESTCVHLRSAFGYNDGDCRTTDCEYRPKNIAQRL